MLQNSSVRPQFTLRTLFVAVTACAILVFLWKVACQTYARQRQAADVIAHFGGTFETEAATAKALVWTIAGCGFATGTRAGSSPGETVLYRRRCHGATSVLDPVCYNSAGFADRVWAMIRDKPISRKGLCH